MSEKKIVIIDYLLGNLFSVKHACEKVGLQPIVSSDPKDLADADAAILPGVGAFQDAMHNLYELELIPAIKDFVASGKPFMGICLGMQLLFEESEEFGQCQGLGLLKGKILKFPTEIEEQSLKVPQIGWNQIYSPDQKNWEDSLLSGIQQGEFMYFVHSFYALPDDDAITLTYTNYGPVRYCSAVKKDNIFATQYHPEKSAREGIKVYENLAEFMK